MERRIPAALVRLTILLPGLLNISRRGLRWLCVMSITTGVSILTRVAFGACGRTVSIISPGGLRAR